MQRSISEKQIQAAQPGRFTARLKHIKPLSMANLPAFHRVVQPLLAGVNSAANQGLLEALSEILGEHSEALIAAASIGSGIPEAEIRDADLADLVEVLGAIMVANQNLNATLDKKLRSKLAQVYGPGRARNH